MAKKKNKNKAQPQQALSPIRFICEKARTQPLGKCYVSPPNWQEAGIADVIVTRIRANGNLVIGIFLVDTFCLGVKHVIYDDNMTPYNFEKQMDDIRNRMEVVEISYNEAHNIIYGAVAFAEEAGIKPQKTFDIGRYILEEDTDDVPLIEYRFGQNGKHLLIVSPDKKEMPYFDLLKKTLGDNFDYIVPYGDVKTEIIDNDDTSGPDITGRT